MSVKTISEKPTIADEIVFDLLTPGQDGQLSADPYKVDRVTIYYIQRDFTNPDYGQMNIETDSDLLAQLAEARLTATRNPTSENLDALAQLENKLKLSETALPTYYNSALPIVSYGTEEIPAWLQPLPGDPESVENTLEHVTTDDGGNTLYGKFRLNWKPLGCREGDYVIEWVWTPLAAGDKLVDKIAFSLGGATQLTTAIPTHFTKPDKYKTLQDRYLPDMFKTTISDGDLSPKVLQGLNEAVADGLTVLEDMANQMVDLIDANATHESLLPALANTYGVRLRSHDPTLWRRQIKRAIPLYKKKGTLTGLVEALELAGIRLNKFTRLWQVTSKYVFEESFTATAGQTAFVLSRLAVLPIDTNNFAVYRRDHESDTWNLQGNNVVTLTNDAGVTSVAWAGIALSEGDSIRIRYNTAAVPAAEQELEDYIKTLPLVDSRDDRLQDYPVKNWNARLLEEDDAFFDNLIPIRNPFHDPLVYGKVRTEFAYSENIYNMEEYNGSKRDSLVPCDIDKDFIDVCSGGLTSKYKVDLEIQDLSNERLMEARDILRDFTPFHAVLHSIDLSGGVNEFIQSPVETVTFLISIEGTEQTVERTALNRTIPTQSVKRDMLANYTSVVTNQAGTGSYADIQLFSSRPSLEGIGLDSDSDMTFLEVMSPSGNAGTYRLSNINGQYAKVTAITGSISEPVDESAFTFRLSNETIRSYNASITPALVRRFTATGIDPQVVHTSRDVAANPSLGNPYTLTVAGWGTFDIADITGDGQLVLPDDNNIPTTNTSSISYILKNGSGTTVATGTDGRLTVVHEAVVDFAGNNVLIRGTTVNPEDMQDAVGVIEPNYYLMYDGTQYKITGLSSGENVVFTITGYTGAAVADVEAVVYQRLLDNQPGLFTYSGIKVASGITLASTLDEAKQYIVQIGTNYYSILSTDGDDMILAGPKPSWTTAGTAITYSILEFTESEVAIPESLYYPATTLTTNRGANVPAEIQTQGQLTMMMAAGLLNAANRNETLDAINQQESITFTIERRAEEGEQ